MRRFLSLLTVALCASCQVGPRCVKGESLACPCSGFETGAQTCDAHGEFGACSCPDPGPCGPAGERRVPLTTGEARDLLQRRWRFCSGIPIFFAPAGIRFDDKLWRGLIERDGQLVDDDSGEWMGPWSLDDVQADRGPGIFVVSVLAMGSEQALPQFFEGPPMRIKLDFVSENEVAGPGIATPGWYTEVP